MVPGLCVYAHASLQEAVHIYLLNKDLYITQEKEGGGFKCPYGLERAWGGGGVWREAESQIEALESYGHREIF